MKTQRETDFNLLTESIATNALFHLGKIAGGEIDENLAELNINFLRILANKTRGNLNSHESNQLNSLLSTCETALTEKKSDRIKI